MTVRPHRVIGPTVSSQVLDDLIARLSSRLGQSAGPDIVGIDGCGGAGKSSLAAAVSAALGGVPVVPTDDFASWEDPIGWWPRLIDQVLEPLALGHSAKYQRYDWQRRTLAEWRTVPCEPVILVEGVTATRRAFRPYLTFAVWVETARTERLRRGLQRDGDAMAAQWAAWMDEEDRYVADERPDLHADAVVRGDAS